MTPTVSIVVDSSMPQDTIALAPMDWMDAMTLWQLDRLMGRNRPPPVPKEGTYAIIHNLGTSK